MDLGKNHIEPRAPEPTSRRSFLIGAGALASLAAIAACAKDAATTGPANATGGSTPGGSTPGGGTVAATPKPAVPTAWKLTDIEHVVIFMQENRTFDEYF